MNRKSTIGMVLLVAMVLTKALLPDLNPTSDDFAVRSNSDESKAQDVADLRNSRSDNFFFSPKTNLLASSITLPAVADFTQVRSVNNNESEVVYSENDLLAQANQTEELDTEPIPMDYVSNTGYGLWRTNTETMTSKSDWEGKVPLDNGNTITDNMSRLFPRTP